MKSVSKHEFSFPFHKLAYDNMMHAKNTESSFHQKQNLAISQQANMAEPLYFVRILLDLVKVLNLAIFINFHNWVSTNPAPNIQKYKKNITTQTTKQKQKRNNKRVRKKTRLLLEALFLNVDFNLRFLLSTD